VTAERQVTVGDIQLTAADREAVHNVLLSNRLSYGPVSRQFEQQFAQIHDSKFAVFSNSGTSALDVALGALKEKYGWQDGDEVIVPSVTFVATVNVVLRNNLKPVFADVNRHTFNIEPYHVADAITDRTRAILPVHLLGLPADMDDIMWLAKQNRLRVVEDSCETMFVTYRGQKVGSFGDIGCFSTYIAHYLVTGVGGLNTTSDPELAVMLRSLVNHGRDSIYISIDDDNNQGTKLKEIVDRRFRFVRVGHSFRATEMEAALGLSQLQRWPELLAARQSIAARYIRGLRDLSPYLQPPFTPPDRAHAFMLFGVVCKEDHKKDLVMFLEENGIETRDLLPIIRQPIYTRLYGNMDEKYPVAAMLDERGFYIGCHQYLTDKDVDYVIRKFHEFYAR
jgi:perosamine synthetase